MEAVILRLLKSLLPEILGMIFAIISLVFGYVLLSFAMIIVGSESFQSTANKMSTSEISFLPATVIAAITLFLIKELIEFFKKKKEKLRKILAIKSLCSEEIKLNYWVYIQMKVLLESVEETNSKTKHEIILSNSGAERFESKVDGSMVGGQAFPKISEDIYHKHILTIAEQEPELYEKALSYHKSIADLQHIRNGVYDYIDENGNEHEFRDGYIPWALSELTDIHDSMKIFYVACTGLKLERPRLR